MEITTTVTAKVLHVNKASSDELLSKFAEMGSPKRESRLLKRRKRISQTVPQEGTDQDPSTNASAVVVERESLLPPATIRRRSVAVIRHLGVGRADRQRSRNFRNRSLLGTIEKTWRKTVEGATKVFMEKHYNRHKRLINDSRLNQVVTNSRS